jgi:hypothetical protein
VSVTAVENCDREDSAVDETVELVKKAVASCGCEVIERRCGEKERCAEAKQYGVRAMPLVVARFGRMFCNCFATITRGQGSLHRQMLQ